MTGTGVDNYKDLSEKQLASLPNLTGPGSHPTWEAAILKVTGFSDAKMREHSRGQILGSTNVGFLSNDFLHKFMIHIQPMCGLLDAFHMGTPGGA